MSFFLGPYSVSSPINKVWSYGFNLKHLCSHMYSKDPAILLEDNNQSKTNEKEKVWYYIHMVLSRAQFITSPEIGCKSAFFDKCNHPDILI